MEHITKILEKKKLSDGQIAVLIQCCDESYQSWHTLSITKDTTSTDVTGWLTDRQSYVQDSHATAEAVDTQLAALIG